MLSVFFVFALLSLPLVHCAHFADEVWRYNLPDTFRGRVAENVFLPGEVSEVAYISFSEELSLVGSYNKDKQVAKNPIIAKVALSGDGAVEWSTPLSRFDSMRNISIALTTDKKGLHLIGTVRNKTGAEVQLLTLDTKTGNITASTRLREFAGGYIRKIVTDNSGIYVCGIFRRSGTADDAQVTESISLAKIDFNGKMQWRHHAPHRSCVGIGKTGHDIFSTGEISAKSTALLRLDTSGKLHWARRVMNTVGLPLKPLELTLSISPRVQPPKQHIFLTSEFVPTKGVTTLLQKLSVSGTLLWTRELGEGELVGLGYWAGYVYTFINGSLKRMSQFGELDVEKEKAADVGRLHSATWVENQCVLVGEDGIRILRAREEEQDEQGDISTITLQLHTRSGKEEVTAMAEYFGEVARGHATYIDGDPAALQIAVGAGVKDAVARVKTAVARSDAGRSPVERDTGVVMNLVGDVEVAQFAGRGSWAVVGAAVVVVGFLVGVGVVLLVRKVCITR